MHYQKKKEKLHVTIYSNILYYDYEKNRRLGYYMQIWWGGGGGGVHIWRNDVRNNNPNDKIFSWSFVEVTTVLTNNILDNL